MVTKPRLNEIRVGDLDGVVAVHCAAFPDSAMTKLGPEAIRRYYLWQLEGPHETYASGAWIGDRLVGFCFGGIQPTAISGFLSKNKRYLAWRLVTRPWLIANPLFRDRLTQGVRILRNVLSGKAPSKSPAIPQQRSKRSYDILSIAVHPQMQGRGVGKLLLERATRQAYDNDFYAMTLFVHDDNAQAIRFYEGHGWERSHQNGVWRGRMVYWLSRSDNAGWAAKGMTAPA